MKPLRSKKRTAPSKPQVEALKSIATATVDWPPVPDFDADEIDLSKPWDFTHSEGTLSHGFIKELHPDSLVSCNYCSRDIRVRECIVHEKGENNNSPPSSPRYEEYDATYCINCTWRMASPTILRDLGRGSEWSYGEKDGSFYMHHCEEDIEISFPWPRQGEVKISRSPDILSYGIYTLVMPSPEALKVAKEAEEKQRRGEAARRKREYEGVEEEWRPLEGHDDEERHFALAPESEFVPWDRMHKRYMPRLYIQTQGFNVSRPLELELGRWLWQRLESLAVEG